MKLLILGGTGFLGPHFVRDATARGHEVTLFNRGKTNPQLFPDLEKLKGDRKDDLSALEGRVFDGVVDTSGYIPAHVSASAGLLRESGQYLFVSSISAYGEPGVPIDEDSPLAVLEDPDTTDVAAHYGALKAACEKAAQAAMPGRATIVRPGLIVGPGDPTDRFTYWPTRIARGGRVLAPGAPSDPTQFVDARDLARFMVDLLEQRRASVFNAAGPRDPYTIGELLETCVGVANSDAKLVWGSAEFLEKQAIAPWMEMPVWVPKASEMAGLMLVSTERSTAAGLRFRPPAETIADTLAWWNEQPEERRAQPRAGLAPDKEKAALAALDAMAFARVP